MKFLVSAQLDMETPVSKPEGLFAQGKPPKGVLLHQVIHVYGKREEGTSIQAALLVDVEDEDHVDLVLEGIEDLYDWDVSNTAPVADGVDDAKEFESFVEDELADLAEEEDELAPEEDDDE